MNSAKRRFSLFLTIALLFVMGTASVFGNWRDFLPFTSRPPETLIITGNYAKSRLLAEVAQKRGRASIMLIAREDGEEQIIYMENYPDAEMISEDQLIEFLAVLSPDQVIVLGAGEYVPERYSRIVRGRYPLVSVDGDDWIKNAKAVARAVEDRRLVERYRFYLGQFIEEQIKRAEFSEDIPMRDRVIAP